MPDLVPSIAEAMEIAIERGLSAAELGEHPVGAVVVQETEDGLAVVSGAGNFVHGSRDTTAHAEILALRGAQYVLERRDLSDSGLLTTCEPCPMCTGAAVAARIGDIIFGASIPDVQQHLAEDPTRTWRLSKQRAADGIAQSDRPNTPIKQVEDESVRQRCLDLLSAPLMPIPSVREGETGPKKDQLVIGSIDALDDQRFQVTFAFEGKEYELITPIKPADFFGWWLPTYAAKTARCGVANCEQIIWPQQPTTIVGLGKLAHLSCGGDPIGAGQLYNARGELLADPGVRTA